MAEVDRRGFLSIATLAALGVALDRRGRAFADLLGWGRALGSEVALADTASEATPGWRPLSDLVPVSVAANDAAHGYPRLAPGSAFDTHPAVALLEGALAGLADGGSALATLQSAVATGGSVLIKPNWVEPSKWASGKITHPALVLAVARLAAEAVGPTGRVIIAEGCAERPDLKTVLSRTGFKRALEAFGLTAATATRAKVEIRDLNSAKSVLVRLGSKSRFAGVSGTLYDSAGRAIRKSARGRYHIAKPILDADLVIDFAKAKVHCSAGVTLAVKNFVGIVPSAKAGNKSVPHFSSADRRAGRKYVLNRTIGRTSADLMAAAMYAASDGSLQSTPQRRVLCLIDGVVSGSKSQFAPRAVATGWVGASFDPVAVDHVATRCMGFDPSRVVSLAAARGGALRLGTGAFAGMRLVFRDVDGRGYCGYFRAKRALRAESVAAHWDDRIALREWSLKAPIITRDGTRVVVRPAAGKPSVRLEMGDQWLALARGSDGTYVGELPVGGSGDVRVTLTDARGNWWTGGVG